MDPITHSFEAEDGSTVTVKSLNEPPIVHTNALPMPDEEARRLERAGAIAPPYPPHWLAALYEQSTALRPAVEALESNVDGHGHRFEPRFDMKRDDARRTVHDALAYERLMGLGGSLRNQPRIDPASLIPSDVEVDMRIAEIELRMRIERMRIEALFSACCPGSDFVKLRKRLRRDMEVTGNAYLGVRRDNVGDVAEFEYLPTVTMRLRPTVCDQNQRVLWVPVKIPVRRTPITIDRVTTYRSFRTFVQFGLATNVFFKQFGDPRMFSAATGEQVESAAALRGARPATEVIHMKIDSALYEYGVPRWIGASPVVTGLRASQEVNAVHFDNNGIPRMLFLISGGTLKDGADQKLSTILQAHAKGRENYGSAVILQATPPRDVPNARVQIQAVPLKEAIPNDALFLNYGARCRDEILSQFRLPKFVTGMLDDVNRSTAGEGMATVEDQVFQPIRYDFDVDMDMVLADEGILFWKYVTNSPVSRDPETSAKVIKALADAGGATINDVRRALTDITNEPHALIEADWADLPLELAKLAFAPAPGTPVAVQQEAGGAAPSASAKAAAIAKAAGAHPARQTVSSPRELVEYLVHVRDAMERGESAEFAAELLHPMGRTLVLPMSGDALAELVNFT